jgi:membrane protease YdiL (CAAX protease family)
VGIERRSDLESSEPRRRTLGVGAAVAALGVGIAAAALAVALGSMLIGGSVPVLMLLVEVGLLGGVVVYLLATRRRIAEALRLRATPSRVYVLAVQLGMALLVANFAATFLLGPPTYDFELPAGSGGLWERLVFAVAVVLVAPIAEESLFRGLLQGALESRMRAWSAIILAAVPFALLHGPQPAVFFLLWSLPVGWVAWRTGSIRPGIIIHAVNNLVGAIGLLAAGQVDGRSLEPDRGPAWFAAPLLALAALWSVRLCRRIDQVAGGVETGSRDDT